MFEWGVQPQIDSSAGTPAYVSPEQASGDQHLDIRSDLYSLACITFEMLAGRPPFSGTTTMQIVAQRFTSVVPDVRDYAPNIPPAVAACVGRAMSLASGRRHETTAAFAKELGTAAAGAGGGLVERLGIGAARIRSRLAVRLGGTGRPGKTLRSTNMFGSLAQDFRYAFRTLRRSPGFAAVVLLTLGFGIAVNSLIFSLFNPYFVRPLPFADADRLVQLGHIDNVAGFDQARFSLAQIEDFREQSNAFVELGAYTYGTANATGDGGAENVNLGEMSGNLFPLLGVEPMMGRTFGPGEDGPGAEPVVVMSYGLWQRRYGGDPSLIGRTIVLDGVAHAVLGVMPPEFGFPFNEIELWKPIEGDALREGRESMWYLPVGRLRERWTKDQARQELDGIQASLAAEYPLADGGFAGINVESMREALNFAYDVLHVMFILLLVAVGFALLMATVNVASLSLARTTGRTGEVAVRTALGANRGRIVQQLLAESVVLAVGGGAIGLAVAVVGARIIGPVLPASLFRVGEMSVDGRVLAFTAAVTLLTPVIFGLMPAITATRANLASALKEGGRGGWGRHSMRARRALVVFEVAMAVILMTGMGLMARSFLAIQRVDLGFHPDAILVAGIRPPASDYETDADVRAYFAQARDAIAAVPGVRAAGLAGVLPLNHEDWMVQFARPGRVPATPEDWPVAIQYVVSPEYFEVLGVPLVSGRLFDRGDRPDGVTAVVINRALQDALWPGEDPLGQTILFDDPNDPRAATIVGVVANTKHEGIDRPDRPQIYRAHTQVFSRRQFVVIAADRTPDAITAGVRTALEGVDPNLPFTLRPYSDILNENTLQWSVSSLLLGVLGVASLILASLGIYGVIAYSVAQRRREIGIRMALGANERRIRDVFLGEGVKLAVAGLTIGLLAALGAGRLLSGLLYGVAPFDPLTFGGVALLLAGVAGAASVLPARRASRVDPQGALRVE